MNPRTQPRELSIGWKLLIQELGKLGDKFSSFVRMEQNDGLLSVHAPLQEADLSSLVDENINTISGSNAKSSAGGIGVVHELTLKLRFADGKLKVAELSDDGQTVWFFIPADMWNGGVR